MQGPAFPCALHSTVPCGRRPAAVIPFPFSLEGVGVLPNWHRRDANVIETVPPFRRPGIDWVGTRDCSRPSSRSYLAIFLYGYSVQGRRRTLLYTVHHLFSCIILTAAKPPLDEDDTWSTRWQAHRSAAESAAQTQKQAQCLVRPISGFACGPLSLPSKPYGR